MKSPATLTSLAIRSHAQVVSKITQNFELLASQLSSCREELENFQRQHANCVTYELHLANRQECNSAVLECADLKLKFSDQIKEISQDLTQLREERITLLQEKKVLLERGIECQAQHSELLRQRCWNPQCTLKCDMKACSKCKVARYCTKDCQLTHWKAEHKRHCSDLKATAAANSVDVNT